MIRTYSHTITSVVYNDITKNITSGSITTSISDPLTQYLIVSNKYRDIPSQTKSECHFYNHFDNKNLEDEISLVYWEYFLQIFKEAVLQSYWPFTGTI